MGYIDPNLFGIISQLGSFLLIGLVTIFVFFTNPIKKFLKRLLGGNDANKTQPEDKSVGSHQ